jgi:hypothetical protein
MLPFLFCYFIIANRLAFADAAGEKVAEKPQLTSKTVGCVSLWINWGATS